MGGKLTEWHVLGGLLALLSVLFAAGWVTRGDPALRPPLEIVGGGFVFNYREAEAYYGFAAEVRRPLPPGSVLQAHFENPSGGDDLVTSERMSARTRHYALRSPPLQGIKANRPYKVTIRVLDRTRKNVLFQVERHYESRISSAALPEIPLTVGPGYHRNPAADPASSQR